MSTPYVELQEKLIGILQHSLEEDAKKAKTFMKKCSRANKKALSPMDLKYLESCGFVAPLEGDVEWVHKACLEIIKEQVEIRGKQIKIRNQLGRKLYYYGPPIGFKEYIRIRGTGGHNRLRTKRFAHPAALKEGDILANGDRLLSEPREGGNGSVLLHLTGGLDGHWIDVAARIPIALLTKEDGAPQELIEK